MKLPLQVLFFALRHGAIIASAIALACLIWTGGYFILLAIAILTNSGVGSPGLYPLGLLLIVALFGYLGAIVFAPASAIATLVCHLLKLPRIWAIPIVIASAYTIHFLMASSFRAESLFLPTALWESAKSFAIFLAIPLGIYWWITEGPLATFDLIKRAWRRVTNRYQLGKKSPVEKTTSKLLR